MALHIGDTYFPSRGDGPPVQKGDGPAVVSAGSQQVQ